MSTGQDPATGMSHNATAELFISTADNRWLDRLGFVPICTVDGNGLSTVIKRFPSYGELADLGGTGPSLGRLYAEGNGYIERDARWAAMAKTARVRTVPQTQLSSPVGSRASDDHAHGETTDAHRATEAAHRATEVSRAREVGDRALSARAADTTGDAPKPAALAAEPPSDDAPACRALHTVHRVQPGQSWGSLSATQIEVWKRRRCDRFFCQPSPMESVGTYRCVPPR